jgi:UDP-2,3-diacylglucosamine pyrophosphatase LpxH
MTQRAYVVGDLHLGAGPGDPLEDFFDDQPFKDFCGRIVSADTTLFLNGDIIDFAQIAPFDTPRDSHLLWTEESSRKKLETAITAHATFFAGLREFMANGGRVVYLVGNHDLDVFWPSIQQRLREVVRADDRQLAFTIGAARYEGVHIEHGFQFTPENCPDDVNDFVHTGADGRQYLERVWGTDFMLQFFNDLERTHPYADNIKPMLALLWHGLRKGWVGGRELLRVLLFLKRSGVPWRGIGSAVLDGPAPPLDPGAVATSFTDPEWQEVVAERVSDPVFLAEMQAAHASLDVCERARVLSSAPAEVVAPRIGESDASATLGLFRDGREERAARDRLKADGITTVVFGHTHEIVDGTLGGCLYNYGTWLPSLDLKSPLVKAKIKASGITKAMLADPSLYRVDRWVVRIDPMPPHRTQAKLVTAEEP